MTSMLLTDRYGIVAAPCAAAPPVCSSEAEVDVCIRYDVKDGERLGPLEIDARRREADAHRMSVSVVLRAVAQRDFLLRRVLAGGLLDHLAHRCAVAGHERGDLLEASPIPLLKLDHARALVIAAARLDRREEARCTNLLDARLREIQMLETPAELLRRHHLPLAELRLGDAKCFDKDHAVDHATGVHHVAQPRLVLEITLAGAIDLGLDVLHDREVRTARGKRRADVALRGVASRHNVLFRTRPPHAEKPVFRISHLSGRLESYRTHHAISPHDYIIGLGLTDLQPLRFLCLSRRCDRNLQRFEAELGGHRVEHRDRLLAVRRLMVEERDLLALELLRPAFLLAQI